MKSRLAPFALVTLLLAPTSAFAKEVAVAPFIAKGGLDPLIALNITSLVSSELDFSSEYEGALQIEEKPSGLTVACLSQSACLRKIGNATGTEHLVAGSVAPAGDQYEIYMVLYNTSGGSFVRKKSYKVETTPERMADSMGGFVKELVTGKSPGAAQAEATVSDDFDAFEDDDFDDFDFDSEDSVNTRIELPQTSTASLDDFEEEPDEWEMEQRRQEEDARRRAEQEAERRAAEEERQRQEAEAQRRADEEERRRQEAEARRRAEEERREREEAERRRAEDERLAREEAERREAERSAASSYDEEEDWDDISFGDASDEIEVEIDDISFGDASSDIVADYGSNDSYSDDDYGYRDYDSGSSSSGYDDDYDDGYSSRSSRTTSRSYDDLDEPEDDYPSSSSSRSSRSSSSDSRSSSSRSTRSSDATIRTNTNDPKLGMKLRAGYSNFQGVFNFVTYGGELAIPVADAVFVNVGLEGYSTQRAIPEALRDQYGGATTRWNHIMPFNLGLTYQNTKRDFRPYIGGDLTLTPYTKNFKTAPGVRLHTGADLMITDQFGLNANLGLGAWYGRDFDTVQVGVKEYGATAAISGGTVILF